MLPPLDDAACDEACSMPGVGGGRRMMMTALLRSSAQLPALSMHLLPLVVTFLLVGALALRRLFPAVSGLQQRSGVEGSLGTRHRRDVAYQQRHLRTTSSGSNGDAGGISTRAFTTGSNDDHDDDDDDDAQPVYHLPHDAPIELRQAHDAYTAATARPPSARRRLVAMTFAGTVALSAVLAELVLCEVAELLDPVARTLALRVVMPTLLFLLVVVIPALEVYSVVARLGRQSPSTNGRGKRARWLMVCLGMGLWLCAFWYMGSRRGSDSIDVATHARVTYQYHPRHLTEACLERVGTIGIMLTGWLSGFAAVSAPWQTFGVRRRPVTATDLERKRTGITSARDMLTLKRSKLRALRRKTDGIAQPKSLVTKVIGSLRSNADVQEIKALELEIAGLRTMEGGLSRSLNVLENRFASERRAASPLGKLLYTPASYAFAVYCIYRILTTTITMLRRYLQPVALSGTTTSDADPINRVLSLLATHVDPSLDQAAWSRQMTFLLSGVLLLASFSSALQTFHVLTRIVPASLLAPARANLALLVAQLGAGYVISSALLLRSNLPAARKSVVSDALGAPLPAGFIDRWFEGWFLCAVIATAVGIFLGRQLGEGEDWDEYEGLEMGQKRS